jgi:hypothetical protein
MTRDSMNDRASAPQTRELTEAELDAVSGGCRKAGGGEAGTMGSAGGGGGGAGKSTALLPAV